MKFKIIKEHSMWHDVNEKWSTEIRGLDSIEDAQEYLKNEGFRYFNDEHYLSSFGVETVARIISQ